MDRRESHGKVVGLAKHFVAEADDPPGALSNVAMSLSVRNTNL